MYLMDKDGDQINLDLTLSNAFIDKHPEFEYLFPRQYELFKEEEFKSSRPILIGSSPCVCSGEHLMEKYEPKVHDGLEIQKINQVKKFGGSLTIDIEEDLHIKAKHVFINSDPAIALKKRYMPYSKRRPNIYAKKSFNTRGKRCGCH